MGAPASQGRLCTKLEEMEIGDYIKCDYLADTANVAGVFSNLGTNISTTELPTEPAATANGFFYFIKADKGLLIADRCVQKNISWQVLNTNNYIYGKSLDKNLLRILAAAEFDQYIGGSDLDGMIIAQDSNVWHAGICGGNAISPTGNYTTGAFAALTFWCNTEWVQDNSSGNSGTRFRASNVKYDNTIWYIIINTYYDYTSPVYVPIFLTRDSTVYNMRKGSKTPSAAATTNLCFRPALEYIDNKKSKTIWY